LYFVQLRIAPQNPKTPGYSIPNLKLRLLFQMTTANNNSILLRYPRNTETVTTNAKTLNISQAIQKIQRPLDSTKITVDVVGIFSLPESWRTII